ncbi:MAG: TdeIII family type II restriction endonuclease [Spirochaetaceae bacterium]|jgi:hypothetical protein|nr:TdeIII family type II restriction endonuclease [Spirochaetaceae bacterium]
MKLETKEQIKEIILQCVNNTIVRISSNSTFRPFHEALLSKELINAAAFERSFSTSFGQGPVEKISQLVAVDNGGTVIRQKETMVNIYKGAADQIDRIMSDLRSGIRKPNWQNEVKTISAVTKGDTDVRRVISDLYIKKGDLETYISIKTVKPNLDQTEIAKKDMLFLKAHNPDCVTYFGLFYYPGGPNRADYNWTMPSKLFNMHKDECVLIGEDYWDTLGGKGTYVDLISVFKDAGNITRLLLEKISKDQKVD